MMTLFAYAIMIAASVASMGLRLPSTVSASAAGAAPKPLNSTLASERFMALAISWVSRVPAAPTTVPAMIIAALSST